MSMYLWFGGKWRREVVQVHLLSCPYTPQHLTSTENEKAHMTTTYKSHDPQATQYLLNGINGTFVPSHFGIVTVHLRLALGLLI